jgi:hypothetical protein
MAVYPSIALFLFLTALSVSTGCSPCFTLCIAKTVDSSTETCPIDCDQQITKAIGFLDTSSFDLTVEATNSSCKVDYEMVWMSDDSRIAVEPIKTAGKASVKKTGEGRSSTSN